MYGYKKKYTRKYARPSRKARSFVKRAYRAVTYPIRKITSAIHTFRKQVMLDSLLETGSNQHLGYQFNLDQLSDETDFQNLYDAYKISKIILTLEPLFSGTNANNVAPFQKWMRIVHDYDDVTPLTQEDQYLAYGGCKSKLVTSPRVINIPLYPKIQQVVQASTTVLAPMKSGWLPTQHDTVLHLGLKIFLPTTGLAVNTGLFNVRATFIVKCKNTK